MLFALSRKLTQWCLAAMMFTIFSPAVTLIIYAIQAELRGAKSIDVNVALLRLLLLAWSPAPPTLFSS
jgi:ATP-binding cassette subfamily C (CFTR/MRP) protein 1